MAIETAIERQLLIDALEVLKERYSGKYPINGYSTDAIEREAAQIASAFGVDIVLKHNLQEYRTAQFIRIDIHVNIQSNEGYPWIELGERNGFKTNIFYKGSK